MIGSRYIRGGGIEVGARLGDLFRPIPVVQPFHGLRLRSDVGLGLGHLRRQAAGIKVCEKLPLRHVVAFLHQDGALMARQQKGLRFDPVLSLIDDADTQARWYFQLKREYRRARAEGRPFENPVKTRILRWKS